MIEIVENPNKTKTVKELGAVDISSIQEDILNLSQECWDKYDRLKPNCFGVFSHTTQHIVFKFVTDYRETFPDIVEYAIWEEWKHKLEPIMRAIVEPYGYLENTIGKVMLAKLSAGCKIGTHQDNVVESVYPLKIHVPIETNPHVKIFVGDRTYHFKVGQAYEMNNMAMHSAANDGDSTRIHLIFTYYDRQLNVAKNRDPDLITNHLRSQLERGEGLFDASSD
ncbi:aspartyl/asparaginyl beta-hydroxylase domain-containing protein [Microcoleus sp. F4-D5]|uniref:aspartyl/asparaginyl beta-hydroxylase domain-containing protein n=1 Tax=Microcoleus sp. F4-D5 TaxID=2818760 RepID=UPI002FD51468